jgi:D-alanyl-D-alanine carboxypeptidase (penicillin-binding protein 5/6)
VRRLNRQKKRFMGMMLSFTLLANMLLVMLDSSRAEAAELVDLKLNVRSAILMEADTGQILFEYNADTAYPPASMAKMMTEYLVLESIESGKIKWGDIVTVSKYSADVIGSGNLLAERETYTVESMFKNMSIYSGNDASVALAEFISGTEENFAQLMNKKAREMGLSEQAHFINATGLSRADLGKYAPTNIEGETLLTAQDAAIIARHIVKEHPQALKYTSIPKEYLRPGDETSLMENWNWMLEGWKEYKNNFSSIAYDGLDGLKTGHTKEAGYCFTSTAQRNGLRLISVVMGAESIRKRFDETRKVLDYGFNNFEKRTIIAAKTEIESLQKVNIKKGVETEVPLVTQSGAQFIALKGAKEEEFIIESQPADEQKRIAPIRKGDVLGTVTVTYRDTKHTVNLVAAADVEKASWIRLFFRGIKNFFGDIFSGIKGIFD